MAQTTPTGASTPAGPNSASGLHLKVFSGEVLKTFNTTTVMKSRVRARTIQHGTSVQFPAIGKADAEYHKPGEVIVGQDITAGEKTILVDDLLISSVFVSNWEERIKHYETRGEYTAQMGQALAQTYDKHLLGMAAKNCRDNTTGAVPEMGSASTLKIGATPTVDTIIDGFYDCAKHFDKTDIPMNDRYVLVTPEVYWELIRDGRLLNRDFGNTNGNQMNGGLMKVAGFEIVPTNNLALDFTKDTTVVARHRGGVKKFDYMTDNTTAVGLAIQKQALGSVHLMDVATEQDYQVNRQGTLVVSRMACGHGVLRPECMRLIDAAV